jgi:hypothetical protein
MVCPTRLLRILEAIIFPRLNFRTFSKHHHSINTLLAHKSSFVAAQEKVPQPTPLRKLASNKFKLSGSADSPAALGADWRARDATSAYN